MDAASGAQVSTVRGAAKRAFGWARAGVRLFILSLIGALIVVVARECGLPRLEATPIWD